VADGLPLLQLVLWSIAVVAVVRLTWEVLEWWKNIIVVTDRRFMVSSGVIARTSRMLPLTQLNNVTFKRPLLGRLLRFGALSAESAGPKHGLETVEYVPEEVHLHLLRLCPPV
jgi:uncharacterized membrane protein YdbT with pleckstrin-like domain